MSGYQTLPTRIIAACLRPVPNPPVDLLHVALDLGVTAVREASERSGFTDFSGANPVIHLGHTPNRQRRQFILAHEIAHVMLRHPHVAAVIGDGSVRAALFGDEERWANSIGGTLLVPDDHIRWLASQPLSWRRLESASAAWDVSSTLLVTRMRMTGSEVSLLRFRAKPGGGWVVASRVGAPPELNQRLRVCETSLRELTTTTALPSDVNLELLVPAGSRLRVSGSARRIRGDVVVLFHAAETLPQTDSAAVVSPTRATA